MAKLKLETKLRRIDLSTATGMQYYQCWNPDRWQAIKDILNSFHITFSDYEICFDDEAYKLQTVSGYSGTIDSKILYNNTPIAEAYILGNPGDREVCFTVHLNALEKVYSVK